MLRKKLINKLLLFSVIILIVTGVALAVYLYSQTDQDGPGSAFDTKEYSPTAFPTVAVPESERTTINDVEVNNFFKDAKVGNRQGDLILNKDYDYSIIYLNNANRFLISITGSPFDETRNKAEQEFVEIMGTNTERLCRMDVSITTPLYANPDQAGRTYKLSFCE